MQRLPPSPVMARLCAHHIKRPYTSVSVNQEAPVCISWGLEDVEPTLRSLRFAYPSPLLAYVTTKCWGSPQTTLSPCPLRLPPSPLPVFGLPTRVSGHGRLRPFKSSALYRSVRRRGLFGHPSNQLSLGGNTLDKAPSGPVSDFVKSNGGHTVVTKVSGYVRAKQDFGSKRSRGTHSATFPSDLKLRKSRAND